MPTNLKKILAREILLFFGAATFVLLCWGAILLWNFGFEKKLEREKERATQIEIKLDSFKRNINNVLVNEVKSYRIEEHSFDIPLSIIDTFLRNNPTAIEVTGFTIGNDTLDIPKNMIPQFLNRCPNAKYYYGLRPSPFNKTSKDLNIVSKLKIGEELTEKQKVEVKNRVLSVEKLIVSSISMTQLIFWI